MVQVTFQLGDATGTPISDAEAQSLVDRRTAAISLIQAIGGNWQNQSADNAATPKH